VVLTVNMLELRVTLTAANRRVSPALTGPNALFYVYQAKAWYVFSVVLRGRAFAPKKRLHDSVRGFNPGKRRTPGFLEPTDDRASLALRFKF
jgi:hypothetical protein